MALDLLPSPPSPGAQLAVVIGLTLTALLGECREYCWEGFNATCGPDEVVLLDSARYGRMQVGKCVTRDYYIGCSADILPYVDKKCSGRHECQFDVPDTELHKVQPCPKDLLAYLEATYSCVKVASGKPKRCEHGKITLTGSSGYIGNIITEEHGFGSGSCPWVISVPPGQKINVTLLDFAVSGPQHLDSHICNMYAVIREHSATTTDITVCGGVRRHKPIYLSESHEVQVEVMTNGLAADSRDLPYFLLKYEAVGCPDMKPPEYGWADRKGERLTIKCNHSGEVWHLVCNGNEWIGEFRNCTQAAAKSLGSPNYVRNSLPLGLIIAVVIGIALGIALGIILLAMVLACQRRLKRRRREAMTAESCRRSSDSDKTRMVRGGDYGYAHVWELQQLRTGHAGECDPKSTVVIHQANAAHAVPEFGQHLLLKCPKGNLKCKEHPYESPRFSKHERSTEIVAESPFYHEFDIESRSQSMPGGRKRTDESEEARYTN